MEQSSTRPYRLRLYPDSALRGKARRVDDVNENVLDLLKGMAEIMYNNYGIGLAAPQVGVLRCVIIADVGEGLIALVNPEVLQAEGESRLEEGCLSLPEIHVEVDRRRAILVRGISSDGREIQREFDGLLARVVQHEIDHLNGVLIIDYASSAEKVMFSKKLKELKKKV